MRLIFSLAEKQHDFKHLYFKEGNVEPIIHSVQRSRNPPEIASYFFFNLRRQKKYKENGASYSSDSFIQRRRLALVTTVTDDIAIAAPANIGLSKMPKTGYNAPAATGMPIEL